jgi:hypothetical protein
VLGLAGKRKRKRKRKRMVPQRIEDMLAMAGAILT